MLVVIPRITAPRITPGIVLPGITLPITRIIPTPDFRISGTDVERARSFSYPQLSTCVVASLRLVLLFQKEKGLGMAKALFVYFCCVA